MLLTGYSHEPPGVPSVLGGCSGLSHGYVGSSRIRWGLSSDRIPQESLSPVVVVLAVGSRVANVGHGFSTNQVTFKINRLLKLNVGCVCLHIELRGELSMLLAFLKDDP